MRAIIEKAIKPLESETSSSADLLKPEFMDRFMMSVREQAEKKSLFAPSGRSESTISRDDFIQTTEQVALRFVEGLASS